MMERAPDSPGTPRQSTRRERQQYESERRQHTMSTPTPHDDEMPAEIDFSGGTRGKFYRPGATLSLPVYLDAEVQSRLTRLANDKGIDFSALVNACCAKIPSSSRWQSSFPRTPDRAQRQRTASV